MTADMLTQARILVVDDNESNVALLEMILRNAGYQSIWTTTDPREVEGLYQRWRFDIILLDIRMPHMDGIQVMERLGQSIRDDYLPVLVLTAQTDMDTRLRALAAGAKDFVTKPFDQAEVLNRIRNMLEVRQLMNERLARNELLEAEVRRRTQDLLARNRELEVTRLEIVRTLGRAGEYRDNETGMHVLRMGRMAAILAEAAGLGTEACAMILQAAPMHDVGKIGVPDHILLKPGKLTPEEFDRMKEHASIGGDILSGCSGELLAMARRIALTHHEKWDGSGYPSGLTGEEIPLEGRITALCDVFDALTSERPYKKAWSVEDAVALIRDGAGRHFDPALVDLFMANLDRMVAVKDDMRDEV